MAYIILILNLNVDDNDNDDNDNIKSVLGQDKFDFVKNFRFDFETRRNICLIESDTNEK